MMRFGLIGTNWITERFIQAEKEIEGSTITAVYSRTEEKAKEFANLHRINTTYTDIASLAKSKEVDAVYIASPNSLHAEQAILLMNNGKHILCEKPLASNLHETRKLQETAQENKVLLMEALKTTFLPNFISIKENLHKIGRIRRYVGNYCKYSSRYDAYKEGVVLNAFNPSLSNGSLMDLGVYCIYPLVVLFGEPFSIKAEGVLLESGVDGEGTILMKYHTMEAVIMHSKITTSYIPSEIQGEEGSILIDNISAPEKIEIRYRDGSVENIQKVQSHSTMYYEIKEFVELLKKGKLESSINSFQRSLITAKIMEEARKQIGLHYPADKL